MSIEGGELKRWVLVVDDQPDHFRVIEDVLADNHADCEVVIVSTETDAIAHLQNHASHQHTPDLVLMNMNLLNQQAKTILALIKLDDALRQIPTIILTSAASEADVITSYRQRCNCFVLKPQDLAQLRETMQVISRFWLNLVTLPLK
ncbi:MAG: response regulator [Phormidesmis sp.]